MRRYWRHLHRPLAQKVLSWQPNGNGGIIMYSWCGDPGVESALSGDPLPRARRVWAKSLNTGQEQNTEQARGEMRQNRRNERMRLMCVNTWGHNSSDTQILDYLRSQNMSKMVHESRNVSHFTALISGCLLGKHESNSNTPDLKTKPMCTSQSLSVKWRSAASVITPESSEKYTNTKVLCWIGG